jgi:hypothetical protein
VAQKGREKIEDAGQWIGTGKSNDTHMANGDQSAREERKNTQHSEE